jgi:hypothetical protein
MTVIKASDYPKFRPIPRLHRRTVITEKINGTNGLIEVTKNETDQDLFVPDGETIPGVSVSLWDEETQTHSRWLVRAGSRNRWLTPDNDNFGFARWVWDHAIELAEGLGEGKHYGEWFGKGIQSGYGLDEKRFALFNVAKWYDPRDPEVTEQYLATFPKAKPAPEAVTVVPVISVIDGKWLNEAVDEALNTLEHEGSYIAPGFTDPEGIVVFHDAAGVYFKATIKNDEQPKSKVAAK